MKRDNNSLSILVFICIPFLLSSCMTYRNLPENHTEFRETKAEKLYYKIDGSGMFAGAHALKSVITSKSGYQSVEVVQKEPSQGLFLHAEIKQIGPSIPAVVFGYFSVATLTVLPFWSLSDGTRITYVLYNNGVQKNSYECEFNRSTFVWMPVALFAWVNLLTTNEEEAIQTCTEEYFNKIQ